MDQKSLVLQNVGAALYQCRDYSLVTIHDISIYISVWPHCTIKLVGKLGTQFRKCLVIVKLVAITLRLEGQYFCEVDNIIAVFCVEIRNSLITPQTQRFYQFHPTIVSLLTYFYPAVCIWHVRQLYCADWARSQIKNIESRKQNRIIHVLKSIRHCIKFENTSLASTLRNARMRAQATRQQRRIRSHALQGYSVLFYTNIKQMVFKGYIHCYCTLIFTERAEQVISALCGNVFHIYVMQSVQHWRINYIWLRLRIETLSFCQ
ncbi:Hypothetical_protein [Hexamita inflata]|uniref:Hypothetical_protein n=1 Tax=Hexamita inflata TaxID=28002 RepID=A0AA86RER1_9EUKA|nr:Hypothetical protein HINF_LOCUS64714 [Hexamita inflata]